MFNLYWPIALLVASNVFYAVCSKSTPEKLNPLAMLPITYIVGAVFSTVLFYLFSRGGSLIAEYKNLNWTSYVLGLSIVGLELGSIYMYKAGWNISVGQLVTSSILEVCLIFIGLYFYRESITPTRLAGIIIILIGLFLVNK